MVKFGIGKLSKWQRYLRDIIIGAVIVCGLVYWQTRDMLSSSGDTQVKQQNLISLSGEEMPLLAQDKPSLLYFFAPWCKVCALSIDNISYLNSDKINVIAIALDYGSEQEVKQFVEQQGVSATVLYGHEALKEQFHIRGYPSYYFVNKDGFVTGRAYGYSTALGLKLREAWQ